MMSRLHQLLSCLLGALLIAVASHANAARVALIVGNAAYPDSPLKNPINDARAMERKLKELGFTVILKENLKSRQIGSTLREFRTRLNAGDEALFFYAGHGLQVKGVNYLPAVDADIASEEDVPQQSINMGSVLDLLDESKAGVKLIFLDACRNNPFSRGFRSTATGLAKVGNAPSGTLISFATRPGSVAADGSGKNGLYTEQLLKQIDAESVPIEQMLKRVASAVEQASQGKQEPWIEGSIKGDFYFNVGRNLQVSSRKPEQLASLSPTPTSGAVRVQSSEEIEQEFWNSIKDSRISQDFEGYISSYPNGRFIGLAKQKIRALNNSGRVDTNVATENNSSGQTGDDVAQKPLFKNGDWWNYVSGGSKYLMKYEADALREHWKENTMEVWMTYSDSFGQKTMISNFDTSNRKSRKEVSPPRYELNFPLFVGKSWKYYCVSTLTTEIPPITGVTSGTALVKGIENITVPAGTFRSFRIEFSGIVGQTQESRTYWYAPEIRAIVKQSLNGEEKVLVTYQIGNN